MKSIDRFYENGIHSPLSNFYVSPFFAQPWGKDDTDQYSWQTVEHYYQAAKTLDPTQALQIRVAATPSISKKLGRKVILRPGFDDLRIAIMAQALHYKFSPGGLLANYLIATGDALLVEGNTWGDTYWGVCKGKGENHLGILLMQHRDWLLTIADQ